jgi:hypothetical protein
VLIGYLIVAAQAQKPTGNKYVVSEVKSFVCMHPM